MLQKKLVRVLGYYIDASFIERIVATFRKLLIDVDWIYGRRISGEGLYEIYLLVREHPNFKIAILDLSKSVGIERVDIFEEYQVNVVEVHKKNTQISYNCNNCLNLFILHIPIYSRVISYSRGEKIGENI
ncbi:MAG: hypothetical protein QXL96_02325 [Ignisphaera sp.]